MRRVTREASMMALAAAVMAAMVLAGGSAIQQPAEPFQLPDPSLTSTVDTSRCLEAPVRMTADHVAVGRAMLCPTGRDLVATLRVDGLTLGAVYTALLVYTPRTAPCHDTPCEPVDLTGGQPTGLTVQIGGGVVPDTQAFKAAVRLQDITLVSGATLSLLLTSPTGPGGPHARAAFVIP